MQENTITTSILKSWINLDITWKRLNTVYMWKIQYSCLTCQNVCQGFFIDISVNSKSLIILKSVRIWTWHESICHFLYCIMKYMKKCLRMGSTAVDTLWLCLKASLRGIWLSLCTVGGACVDYVHIYMQEYVHMLEHSCQRIHGVSCGVILCLFSWVRIPQGIWS